jgi:hypothetical protein
MDFNELVFDKLGLIFQKHNLHVTEQFKNYVKLKSDRVVIALSHDVRENSSSFDVGTNEGSLYPVNNNVIKAVFNSDIKVRKINPEAFVNNLAVFFEGEGKALLNGDAFTLKAVEKYVQNESEEYTMQIVEKQNLDAANKAWQEGNYHNFIKYLDKIDIQKLPPSFALKYKIARQKSNG